MVKGKIVLVSFPFDDFSKEKIITSIVELN